MDALVIGSQGGLADAVVRALRHQALGVLQAIPADVADAARTRWLLDEAGNPSLVVVIDTPPYATAHELLAHTTAEIVLVAEQRAAIGHPGGVARRSYTPRDEPGLTVVPFGRAGRRWFHLGARRQEPLTAARAASIVLRSGGAAGVSCR
jgi:hypothetical protein